MMMMTTTLRNASIYRIGLLLALLATTAVCGFSCHRRVSFANCNCHTHTTLLFVSSDSYAINSNSISIDENAQRDMASMNEWALNYGVQTADGIGVGVVEEETIPSVFPEFGVATAQPLAYGQPILSVPQEMILSGNKALAEFGTQDGAENLFELLQTTHDLPYFYVMCKLIKEVELGMESPWYPWLNSLPRYFSNGSSMTHLCTDLLPPLVGNLVTLERVRFRQFFRALKQVDSTCMDKSTRTNKELAKWAFAIVYTRSIISPMGDGDVQLIPVADMVGTVSDTIQQISCHCIANTPTRTRNIHPIDIAVCC